MKHDQMESSSRGTQGAQWPLVSLVLLNYNSDAFLESCLLSVLKTWYPCFEIIFVVNGSSVSSVTTATKLLSGRENVEILQNHQNVGFAEGNNIGASHAKGKYVLFLNVDTQVEPDWLMELVKVAEGDDSIAALQGKLYLSRERSRLDSVGHYIDYLGIEAPMSAAIEGTFDDGTHDIVKEIFYAKGACLLVQSHLFNRVGGFDSRYFTDHEEIDLCWRLHLAGYRVVYVPGAIVYHFRGGASWQTRRRNPASLLFHLRKNHVVSMLKNYEMRNVVKYLPWYVTYLGMHAAYRFARNDSKTLTAYVKACIWVVVNIRYVFIQRARVQSLVRRVPDREVMKYMVKPQVPLYFLR